MNTEQPPKFVEVHVLQWLPFANLNRGDDGRPKTMDIGGRTRARWSSQAQKRQARLATQDVTNNTLTAHRVRIRQPFKRAIGEIVDRHRAEKGNLKNVTDYGVELAAELAEKATLTGIPYMVVDAGSGATPAEQLRDILDTTSTGSPAAWIKRVDKLADKLADGSLKRDSAATKKEVTKLVEDFGKGAWCRECVDAINDYSSYLTADVAVFGRFFTGLSGKAVIRRTDGALSVAHAFTTHPVRLGDDFWTVQTDPGVFPTLSSELSNDDEPEGPGAGNMGHNLAVSGVFYRYAALDLNTLATTLRDDKFLCSEDESRSKLVAEVAVTALWKSATESPYAWRRSAAPTNDPVLVVIRSGADSANLSQAFVGNREADDLVKDALERFTSTWATYSKGDSATRFFSAVPGTELPGQAVSPFTWDGRHEVIDQLVGEVEEALSGPGQRDEEG